MPNPVFAPCHPRTSFEFAEADDMPHCGYVVWCDRSKRVLGDFHQTLEQARHALALAKQRIDADETIQDDLRPQLLVCPVVATNTPETRLAPAPPGSKFVRAKNEGRPDVIYVYTREEFAVMFAGVH